MTGGGEMTRREEELGRLLRALPPAPAAWVAAAVQLPAARRALADIEGELSGSGERAAQTQELEDALARAGYEPTPELVEAVRHELRRAD